MLCGTPFTEFFIFFSLLCEMNFLEDNWNTSVNGKILISIQALMFLVVIHTVAQENVKHALEWAKKRQGGDKKTLKERYDELVAKGKDKFEMVKKIMFLKHVGAHAATVNVP